MTFANIGIILLSICMSSTAHVFLKKGMLTYAGSSGLTDKAVKLLSNPWIVGGMFLHVSALVVWLWALSKVDISFAYPFLTLGFVIVSVIAYFWLGEILTSSRLIGMAIVAVGILVISIGG